MYDQNNNNTWYKISVQGKPAKFNRHRTLGRYLTIRIVHKFKISFRSKLN